MTAAWVEFAVLAAVVFTRTPTPDQLSRFTASPAGDALLGVLLVAGAVGGWLVLGRRSG